MKTCVLFFVLLFAVRADALSVDVSALSSSATRQLLANVDHIQTLPQSTVEISGKYFKSQGREDQWDAGIAQTFRMGVFRIEDDFRYFSTHTTFSGGVGLGLGPLAATGGVRVEYQGDVTNQRRTFGKLTLQTTVSRGPIGISAKTEALARANGSRLDYGLKAKYQLGPLYVALFLEDVRDTKAQGVSLGVKVF